jgi:hypothetical protein
MKGGYVINIGIAFCLSLFSLLSFGQDKFKTEDKLNELTVDRPGIAEAPFTVSPGMYQLETGFDYYKRTDGEIYFLPVSLFRMGLSKQAELRVTVKHILDKSTENNIQGISPLTVGIKTHIIEQRGWIPETDILADIIMPLGNSDLQPTGLGHDILLLFQNDISSKFAINYNVGLIWDGFTDKDTFTASFCLNYLPSERIGLFIEYYDFLRRKGVKEHGIDGGFTFLIAPHVQADFSAGISVADSNFNHFVSTGISIRID